MQINFPFSKKVRVIDTDSLPVDVLELILRRGVLEMSKDPSTKDIIRIHSHIRKPEAKSKVIAIG